MNPDDEPEDGHGAPQPPREEGAAELGPAPRAYVPPKNMYAMGVEEPDVAHADAEVAEGEPEDGEYVDAELEQHQAAPALRYESEASTDDEDAAGHTGESGVQPDEEQWGAAEADADADAPALEGDDQTATMAHQASEAAEEDNDVDGDDEDDEDDEDDDDDGDDDSDDDEDDDSDDDDGDKSEDDDDDGEVDDDEAEDGLGEGQQEYAQEEYAQEELPQEVYADAAPEEIEHTVAAFAQQTDEPDAPGALYEPTPSPAVAPPPPPQQRPQQQRPQQQRPQQQPRQQPQREQKQQPPRQPPVRQRRVAHAQDDDGFLFGAPDIPMPPARRRIDKQRARDARANLDLDLGRIKRIKRFGLVITTATVLFVAFVLAPVTWVGAYLFFDPPANVLMMQRAAEGETIRHRPVPLNRMSPHMVRAVIAAEDANFCAHDGFDVEAIQGAMQANARGGRTRGASTVSQQTAKNLFLWPDRSWLRKGLETYFTALVEFMWPKRRIMEAYLNTAEWGDGIFGVEAAARARFGVSAADLTPLQAARLAAVLPNPNRWRADAPGPYVRQRSAALVGRARVVRDERLAACVLNLDRPG